MEVLQNLARSRPRGSYRLTDQTRIAVTVQLHRTAPLSSSTGLLPDLTRLQLQWPDEVETRAVRLADPRLGDALLGRPF